MDNHEQFFTRPCTEAQPIVAGYSKISLLAWEEGGFRPRNRVCARTRLDIFERSEFGRFDKSSPA